MTFPLEHGRSLFAISPESSHEREEAIRLIRGHYRTLGARAAVFMDKDDTVIDMEVGKSTDPRLEEIITVAQERGIVVSYDSDSSFVDLEGKLGMRGLPIAERGGLVYLPNGTEIHLVQGGEWFMQLLHRFSERVHRDKTLRNNIAVLELDPWPLLHSDIHLPGTQDQVVMINRGRRVTAGIITGLLDQSQGGKIVRHTPESRVFFQKIAGIFTEERDILLQEQSFPDTEGMVDDFNQDSELVIFKSAAASKQRALAYLTRVLGIPVFHIGDNAVSDNMTSVPGVVTMAVGNGELKNVPGVIAAKKPMASGVVELFEAHILPRFS